MTKPTHQDIAQQAYQIYVRNGSKDGHALEHWLEAEAALQQQQPALSTPAPKAAAGKAKSAPSAAVQKQTVPGRKAPKAAK